MFWALLLALVIELPAEAIVYSQGAGSDKFEIQFEVKEFSSKEAEKFLTDWSIKNKQEAVPTVDVSGKWCFLRESVSSKEKIARVKTTMELFQDSTGKVSGKFQNLFFGNDKWYTGRMFIIEGKVSENILTANLLDAESKIVAKTMFSFEGNTFEGMLVSTTEPPDINKIEAMRCTAQ